MTKLQALKAKKAELRRVYQEAARELDAQIAQAQEERKQEIQLKKDQAQERRWLREAKAQAKLEETKRKLEERTAWLAAKAERKKLTLAKWREEQIAAGLAH